VEVGPSGDDAASAVAVYIGVDVQRATIALRQVVVPCADWRTRFRGARLRCCPNSTATFGEFLRRAAGLTQEELADRAVLSVLRHPEAGARHHRPVPRHRRPPAITGAPANARGRGSVGCGGQVCSPSHACAPAGRWQPPPTCRSSARSIATAISNGEPGSVASVRTRQSRGYLMRPTPRFDRPDGSRTRARTSRRPGMESQFRS
jgi:hypothetical protein